MRTVLITGASTGIGAACATRLAARGVRVLAGVRRAGDAPPATEEVILDVTDAEQIAAAAGRVNRLDGLVANAGIAVAAPLEYLPLAELRRQLEVNVVGQLACIQSFLPALRAARGRVVLMGSIAGKSALPFLGAYAMSKHAIEAMADSLRLELAPDGIHVALVEPGTIATPIWTKPQANVAALPPEALSRYGTRIQAFQKAAAGRAAKAAPVDIVADAVEHALSSREPKARYLVGRDAKLRSAVERLPDRLRDRVIAKTLLEVRVPPMDGLMMDFQLTLPHLLRRAEMYFPDKKIVTRLPDKSFHEYTYRDCCRRSRQLAVALKGLGLEPGDRVATFAWNHYQHMECYLGIPCGGFVLHTLNLRLHPSDLAYIATHAGDKVIVVDKMLLPLAEQFVGDTPIEHVFVVEDSYEELLATADADDWEDPNLDENAAAAMCYTSGTTGMPKGVVYSHRSTVLHTLGVASGAPLGFPLSERDTFLPVVPMFHANAWGYPYIATMMGANVVYPGPHLDWESLLDAFEQWGVTWTAGVPTIWLGILAQLDANPDKWDLSALKGMLCGGSAPPRAMIDAYKTRHGLNVVHGWGMTETSPVASVSDLPGPLKDLEWEQQLDYIEMQGMPLPFVELRAKDVDGNEIPWDDEAMGELEIRGPWVASGYYNTPEQADRWTEDGWFKTGDIVSMHPAGFIRIQDRTKDVIKSGGEWISSVALENALMGHPAVAEAAVIAMPDEKWAERPMAVVVLRPEQTATADELREFLAPQFAKWWLPERFEFVDEIPKTAVGKFRKTALREMFVGETTETS